MSDARPFDACHAAGALRIEHCDIPVGMTLAEWRRIASDQRRLAKAPRGPRLGGLRRALRLP